MLSSGGNRCFGMACHLLEMGPLLLNHWTNFRGQGQAALKGHAEFFGISGRVEQNWQPRKGLWAGDRWKS